MFFLKKIKKNKKNKKKFSFLSFFGIVYYVTPKEQASVLILLTKHGSVVSFPGKHMSKLSSVYQFGRVGQPTNGR